MDEQTPISPVEQPQPEQIPVASVEQPQQPEQGSVSAIEQPEAEPQATSPKPKKNKKPILIGIGAVAAVAIVVGLLLGTNIIHAHEWSQATCSEAKHCYICGKSQGGIDPDAHNWMSADCTAPRRCSRCGLTDGDPNPEKHSWRDATCMAPRTCSSCSKTSGDVAPHKYSNGVCSVCGTSEAKATTTKNTGFTPVEFCEDMDNAFGKINRELGGNYKAASGDVDGARVCAVLNGSDKVFAFAFLEDGEDAIYDKNSRSTTHLLGTDIGSASDETVTYSLMALVMTLHPSVDVEEAIDICIAMLEKNMEGEIYEYKGVKYFAEMEDGDNTILVSLE